MNARAQHDVPAIRILLQIEKCQRGAADHDGEHESEYNVEHSFAARAVRHMYASRLNSGMEQIVYVSPAFAPHYLCANRLHSLIDSFKGGSSPQSRCVRYSLSD